MAQVTHEIIIWDFNDSTDLFLVVKNCDTQHYITDTKYHPCQTLQDPQDTTMAAMYSCTHDLCNVERNVCEDCQGAEDLDACSNANDTKIDTNHPFAITLNVFLLYCIICFEVSCMF